MTVWRWVGRMVAIVVAVALVGVILFWPVVIWGWTGWTGLYVGVTIGRFVLFESQQPTVLQRMRADASDVR